MQYLEHILVGIAFLIFLTVCFAVGAGLLIKLLLVKPKANVNANVRAPAPAPTATVYPIPPAERGTGQHVTLADLVDDHLAAEDQRRRRQRINDKLYDWASGSSDPKGAAAPPT